MRKILSLIIVATMLVSVMAIQSSAAMNIGLVKVLYADSSTITIDGNVGAAEWDETNSLKLKAGDNTAGWTGDSVYTDEIQFFYSWGDDGLYMAAKVIDSTFSPAEIDTTAEALEVSALRDRFQIAFNPCGLIADGFNGLFFSFAPTFNPDNETIDTVTGGELICRKHNWEESNVDGQMTVNGAEATYKGAYTRTADGWDMEVVVPWALISTKDRIWDVLANDVLPTDVESKYLSIFDPNNEDRSKAFTKAIIAYVDCEVGSDTTLGTARTATTAEEADNFQVESFDLVLKFYKADEDKADETVTPYTVDELKAFDPEPFEIAAQTDAPTEAPDVDDPSEEDDETKAVTNATTNSKDTTAASGDDDKGGSPIIWIVIAVVAVVAVAVVGIVVAKKKK